ncbi:hypothetical protein LCGC14_2391410 [marine sediment metagenome]|uniref:MtN3 and saliva related transmembrane protein n=1 Tax=marine sediment metagenome TaxID=412755 RepID=A0A0F9BY28_9ZZZZ
MEILGFLAGLLIAIAYVAQLWHLFRRKSARDISLSFTLILLAGASLWVVYGIIFSLKPIILWNTIMFGLFGIVFYAKLRYGR